ncbi:MAG: hypothetical protein JNM17_16185 [Archangium sp.]|nr:hypothetical protein [Archangium sp.]
MASTSGLNLIVEFNEASKEMESKAFEVRLRALDALVRSAKDRTLTLAGFREVSSQMRCWGDDLTAIVVRLRKACAASVVAECVVQALKRRQVLLRTARCDAAEQRLRAREAAVIAERSTHTSTLRATLEDLRLLGLMAAALSRTAMIEATSAIGEDRTVLMLAAREFGEQAADVLERGRGLERSAREAA